MPLLRYLHEFHQSKWHHPRRVEWQLPSSFYYCSILCLDCFKDWVIRKHKKCAFLHNTITLGSDLEFPKQNLYFAPPPQKKSWFFFFLFKLLHGNRELDPTHSDHHKWCYVAFLSWPRLPLAGTGLQKPARTCLQCRSGPTLSAAGDRQVPCKWSKCSSLAVNNGTYITAIVIKICNTSRDHYGAIKKILLSVFKTT